MSHSLGVFLKVATFGIKFTLASVVAVLITSLFVPMFFTLNLTFYELNGRPFPHCEPNTRLCRATIEGYINGMLDSNGFNNEYCVEHNINIPNDETNLALLLGSSHMEAFQVPMNRNCCYLINKEFESKSKDLLLYNVGFAGISLPDLALKMDKALDYFQPRQFVLIETKDLPDPELAKSTVLEKKEKKHIAPLIGNLENKRFLRFISERTLVLRLIKNQIQTTFNQKKKNSIKDATKWNEENVDYLRVFLKMFSEPSHIRNVQPILFFHPHFTLHEDGSASLNPDPKDVELYRSICEEQGIIFLYLGDRFMREYEEKNVLPYGFWNTLPNAGYLNKDGRRTVAEELGKVIDRLEEEQNKVQ